MEKVVVETTFGAVNVWCQGPRDGPLVLAIRGAFPHKDHLTDLDPGCGMALLHLPGMYTPAFKSPSMANIIAAYDEVIGHLFPHRDITAVGISTGALAALGLRSPEVRRVLAVEPFFSTSDLWPLIDWTMNRLRSSPDNSDLRNFCREVYGYSLEGVQGIDYHYLAESTDQTRLALVGDIPLFPRRELSSWPSLSSGSDLVGMEVMICPSGHEVPTLSIRKAFAALMEIGARAPA